MKTLIVIVLLLILGALAGAGLFMLRRNSRQPGRERDMARVLALRVGLSVALFLFILLAWSLGWIHPTGLPVQG
jgi:hypothetical protein